MEELSVKIRIGDRVYPMKVHTADETFVRTAGKLINEQIKAYKAKFGINDQQDLLAMVAFDCLVDMLKSKGTAIAQTKQLMNKMLALHQVLDQALCATPV